MTDLPVQEAEQLLCEMERALAQSKPQQAQTAARSLDQLIRAATWSPEQLRALAAALKKPASDGATLRQRLLTELRDHRRNRDHLLRYQTVEYGR